MAPLRVAQAIEPCAGGTKHHLLDLVEYLHGEEFELSLLCSTRRDPSFEEDIEGLRARGVATTVIAMEREITPWRDWRAFRRFRRHFATHEYDIIHAHSSKAGFLARAAAPQDGPGVIYTPHGFSFEMHIPSRKQMLYAALERWAARRTDRIIALCEGERQAALQWRVARPEQVVVIPNGIDPARVETDLTREEAREAVGVGPEEVCFGSVGETRPQKGYGVLIRAAARMLKQEPQAVFLVAGGGERLEGLREEAREFGLGDRFRFLGHCSNVRELLRALDTFVLPSLWEAAPYALLEAMAAGLPVIGSDIGGVRDVVADGRTGHLVRPDDPEALAERLMWVARNREEAAEVGAAGRRLVETEYHVAEMTRRIGELYREVAGARG